MGIGFNKGPQGGRGREREAKALEDLEKRMRKMKGVPTPGLDLEISSRTSQIDVMGPKEKEALKRIREQGKTMKGKKSFPEF